ncbi:MAG: hypothetical protein EGQ09_24035 [Clostridiales bacterium]|nr:hypothetical protein [Clostridiales bacterium]
MGVGLFQSDEACDIREDYKGKLIVGKSDEQAENEIIQEYFGSGDSELWIPLAITQWKVGRLSDQVKRRALDAIQSELSAQDSLWDGKALLRRKEVLLQAEKTLDSDMPLRKKVRWPSWAWRCPWKCGNVIQCKCDFFDDTGSNISRYVLFRIVGISTPPPDTVAIDVVALRLYDYISQTPPVENVEEWGKKSLQLKDFLLLDGKTHFQICYESFFTKYIKEHDMRVVSEHPIDSSVIEDVYVDSKYGSGGKFEAIIRATFNNEVNNGTPVQKG